MRFKEFMDMQSNDDLQSDDDIEQDNMQPDDNLKALKKLVDDFNEYAPLKDNMMTVVQDQEGDELYTLFIGPDEVTKGSTPELITRVKQIRHEHGF